MKRGAILGLIVGGILGILVAVCIVWIGLIFDDNPDGIAPLAVFGVFAAVMVAGFCATVGAVIGALVNVISKA